MAFQKKTWVNRIVQYPLRRLLTMVRPDDGSGTEIVDIQREDGEITQEGDAFSAENMNDLESRIEDAFEDIQIDVDDELDNTSTNPVQNKVITQELSTVDTKATNAASAASSAQSKANAASSTASSAASTANSASTNATRALNMIRSTSSFPTGDAYSSSSSYKVGDMVIYNNTLYRCKTACSAASWSVNANNFEAISLASALTDVNNDLTQRLSTDYPKQTYANAIEYEKRNGICCIAFKSAVTASASFTLPDDFSTDLYLTARGTSGNSYAVVHMSNGHPVLEYYYDGANGLYTTITYPAIN